MSADEPTAVERTAAETVAQFVGDQVETGVSPLDAYSALLHALFDRAELMLPNSDVDELFSQTALRYEDFYGPPAA